VGPKAGLDGRKILPPPGFDPRTVQPDIYVLHTFNGQQYQGTVSPYCYSWYIRSQYRGTGSHLTVSVGTIGHSTKGLEESLFIQLNR
jgi:hypothetical protein